MFDFSDGFLVISCATLEENAPHPLSSAGWVPQVAHPIFVFCKFQRKSGAGSDPPRLWPQHGWDPSTWKPMTSLQSRVGAKHFPRHVCKEFRSVRIACNASGSNPPLIRQNKSIEFDWSRKSDDIWRILKFDLRGALMNSDYVQIEWDAFGSEPSDPSNR